MSLLLLSLLLLSLLLLSLSLLSLSLSLLLLLLLSLMSLSATHAMCVPGCDDGFVFRAPSLRPGKREKPPREVDWPKYLVFFSKIFKPK